MQRVTICWSDGGDCRGMGGSSGGGLTDTQLRASAVPVSLASVPTHAVTVGTLNIGDAGVLNVNFPATQPVSLASVPTHAVTGTFWQATQPVSLASVPTHGVTGTFWQATQPVSGTFWQATQPISGTVTANAGTGTMAVSGPLTDAQLRASALPVSGAFFQATQPVSIAAPILVQEGSATRWSCFKQGITATTECQAAPGAGQRLYVTSVSCSNGVATVQGVDVVQGTGTNCASSPTALTHKFQMGTNALTTSPFLVSYQPSTPLVPPQNVAICVRPTAATVFGCTLTGFTAP